MPNQKTIVLATFAARRDEVPTLMRVRSLRALGGPQPTCRFGSAPPSSSRWPALDPPIYVLDNRYYKIGPPIGTPGGEENPAARVRQASRPGCTVDFLSLILYSQRFFHPQPQRLDLEGMERKAQAVAFKIQGFQGPFKHIRKVSELEG